MSVSLSLCLASETEYSTLSWLRLGEDDGCHGDLQTSLGAGNRGEEEKGGVSGQHYPVVPAADGIVSKVFREYRVRGLVHFIHFFSDNE